MSEDQSTYFKKGSEVEISSNDDGFRGSWFEGTVLQHGKQKNKVFVEYKTLMADGGGTPRKLRETLEVIQLRPPAPREKDREFSFSEEVDAYYNDGWWEGVITKVLGNGRFSVFFRATREQLDFDQSELRLHREWVSGKWVPPLEIESETSASAKRKRYCKGEVIEVKSDEDGFCGSWFAATVIEQLDVDKFLIEYRSLRNDDDTEFLEEVVHTLNIRPDPPKVATVDSFKLLEEVDALYNDGWWVGVISKVLDNNRYVVYFAGTGDEMEFDHSDLRLHQEWINGKWMSFSGKL